MIIDCSISHITQPEDNLFLDLGFPQAEARRLQAISREQIEETRKLKEQLMSELNRWMKENHLKQAGAAQALLVSRPRVSDVVNKKTSKFTIDALVEMLARAGKQVTLTVA